MYIDSPNFVRRKVLNSKNTSSPNSNSNQTVVVPRQYQYGLERSLLADHVANRLNSHDQDFQILQRFRKEAQELKRQKWLSKKYPKIQYKPHTEHIKSKSQNSLKPGQETSMKKVDSLTSIVQQDRAPNRFQQPHNNNTEIINHFQRLLASKEHQIEKKDRKLKKSREALQRMASQIKKLEREKQFVKKQQELQVQKINSLIEQMNYKIASNRAIFQQQLTKLKSSPIYDSKRINSYKEESIPLQRNRKKSFRNAQSQRLLIPEPSIFYQLPRVTKQSYSNSQPFKRNSRFLTRQNPELI